MRIKTAKSPLNLHTYISYNSKSIFKTSKDHINLKKNSQKNLQYKRDLCVRSVENSFSWKINNKREYKTRDRVVPFSFGCFRYIDRARRGYLGFSLSKKKTRARKTDVLFQWARDEKSSFECVFQAWRALSKTANCFMC